MTIHHEGTEGTPKLHEGGYPQRGRYQTPAAKARATVVSEKVIGAMIEVHRELGPGLLESTYEKCLAGELSLRGVEHRCQVAMPVTCKGTQFEDSYRLDMLVEDLVVVELKAVDALDPIHEAQLLTYLRLSGRWLGLLVNFNTRLVKQGLRRYLNG